MIRHAMESDVADMLVLARQMHSESTYKTVPFSPSRTEYTILNAIKSSDQAALIAVEEGRIVAFLGAYGVMYSFSTAIATYDFALFVDKAYRSLNIVVPLIKQYEEWAKSIGAVDIFLGNTAFPLDDRVYRLFEKMGFKYAGRVHRMHVHVDVNRE